MRISDWSSDVCSSDLLSGAHRFVHQPNALADPIGRERLRAFVTAFGELVDLAERGFADQRLERHRQRFGRTLGLPSVGPRRPELARRLAGAALRSYRVDRKSTRLNSSH